MKAAFHISLEGVKGQTRLQNSYITSPFKLADVTEPCSTGELQLVMMNASPGILDGDDYHIRIEQGAGTRLRLHTQAYQRIFNMKEGAQQLMEVYLKKQASFVYLPHPTVPHENSIFSTRNHFYLDHTHRLIFGEVLTCGRKLNGEAFLFSKYHSHTRIYINQQLVISENLLMEPGLIHPAATGQLEGYSHQASLIIMDSYLNIKEVQRYLLNLLTEKKGIEFGISVAPANGLLIRLLGHGADALYQVLLQIEQRVNTPVPQP